MIIVRTGGIVLGNRKAVSLAVIAAVILLEVALLPPSEEATGSLSFSARSRAIGKVIDLNLTTENPHSEHLIRIGRVPGKYTDMFQFMDINADSYEDMIFRQINGSLTSNEDVTHIYAVLGPLYANATYSLTDLPHWTLPFRIKSFLVCDHNGDGAADLIVSKKQYKGEDLLRNSSFIGYEGAGGPGPVIPWSEATFTVWLDPAENRTAENVTMLDVDGDGSRDLLLQTRTWYRKRPQDTLALPTNQYLIKDGTNGLSGRLVRTDIGTELIAERQDGAIYGLYYLDHPLKAGDIMGDDTFELVSFERNFRLPTGGWKRGAVLIMDGLDLSAPVNFARGNVSATIFGVVYDGYTSRNSIGTEITDLDRDGFDDILVTMQAIQVNFPNQFILIFNGNTTLPDLWDIASSPPSSTIEGFTPLALDHDGDGSDDLLVGYYKETVASRSSCGVLRLGLDLPSIQLPITTSSLEDLSILGARSNDEIGRTLVSSDLDHDGRSDILVQSGPSSMYIDLYVIMGLHPRAPRVNEVRGLPGDCERGDQLTAEVFARDPQNYPRYLSFELEIRTVDGEWTSPEIVKTVHNFSYEEPYKGSTLITFKVPTDFTTGHLDLMVKATNTFGLVSEPFLLMNATDIKNRAPTFVDTWLTPEKLFRGDVLSLGGTVEDIDDQGDLTGQVILRTTTGRYALGDLMFQASGQFSAPIKVPDNCSIGNNFLYMTVTDDNGASSVSGELVFEVLPKRLMCGLQVEDRSVLRGEDLLINVTADSDLGPISVTLRLVNDTFKSKVPDLETKVPVGETALNITIPLTADLGYYTLEMVASDGFWDELYALDGQIDVSNNLPMIEGPLKFTIPGLSGVIDLKGKGHDAEDQEMLTWSLIGDLEVGLSAYFKDPSGQLFVDMADNRTRSLAVKVSDNDGGSDSEVLEIGSLWTAPPIAITIKVMGPNDEPLKGANITLLRQGRNVAQGSTTNEGTSDLEVPFAGTYSVQIEPPSDSAYVENVRSGYLPFQGEIVVDAQTILYEVRLELKQLVIERPATLSVTVNDPKGMPVEGANVTLKGPLNKTLQSDGSGNALFTNLPPGTYKVQASKGDVVSEETTIVLGEGKFLTQGIVLDIGKDSSEDDDFPYLELIIGSLVVGLLIGLLFLYLMGTTRRKGQKDVSEE